MAKFFDPAIKRKSAIVDQALTYGEHEIPLPSVVEISESGTCNRTCVFCPRSDPDYPDIKEFIEPELLEKLARQLGEVGFRGIFLFSGFVEPLLDKNIYSLVALVGRNLPECRVEMVTNGDVLNKARLLRLFANGLSTILISVYDGKEDAERLESLCRDAGLTDEQFVIRHRYLPEEEDFGITLSNRAGMMNHAEYTIPTLEQPLQVPCYYPHYTFFMDYLGDVLLCPHDWGKKLVVGNMKEQNFMDIWAGDTTARARRRLASADRHFAPCGSCDVQGMLMGRNHAAAWKAFDAKARDKDD